MPFGSFHGSATVVSALFASDSVRLRSLLLVLLFGRPRSMIDGSDMLRLWVDDCAASGSRRSTRGEPRFDAGEEAEKGFEKADGGVGRGMMLLGDRLRSTELEGVILPDIDVMDVDVVSWGLLGLVARTRGVGEGLRSTTGDFGGTAGGFSELAVVLVSSLRTGLGVAPGLRIGDSGLPGAVYTSEVRKTLCS